MRERTSRLWGAARAHPVLAAFLVALVARAFVATGLFVTTGGHLVPDDLTYHDIALTRAEGAADKWDPRTAFLYSSAHTFIAPIAFLYYVFGPVRLLGQLVAALWGAATAAATAAIVRPALPAPWPLMAGLTVALLPSQIIWSSLTLKDAAAWALLAGIAVAGSRACAHNDRSALGWFGAVLILLLLLSSVRDHSFMVAVLALVAASAVGAAGWRLRRFGVSLAVLLIVPWLVGLGPAGQYFFSNTGSLEQRRYNNAVGSATAIVPVPKPPASGGDGGQSGALPPAPEPAVASESGAVGDLRHVPRGLSVMLLEPFPTRGTTSGGLRLAQAETVLWYPLVLLAAIGLWPALRRHPGVATLPVLIGGGVCVLYALAEGNVGTAYRHRGEFVWAVAVLAVMGAAHLAAWHGGRQRARAEPHGYAASGEAPTRPSSADLSDAGQ